jgi:threonine aldolase
MTPEDVAKAIRKVDGSLGHFPNGSLVCVENTSNRGGGTCYPQETLDAIAKIAHDNDCTAHMDGARLFNAAIATGTDPARIVRDFDSVSICLSKGLGAPVGSVLVGSSDFIALAHRWRKMFGGGMRQAGVIAACGLYAIGNHIERLTEDHEMAHRLAVAVNSLSNFDVELDSVQSNMVFVRTREGTADKVVEHLASQGVDILTINDSVVRAVTHLHVTDEDIERAISAFSSMQ